MSAPYKKLEIKKWPHRPTQEGLSDARYFKSFKQRVETSKFSAVTSINVMPTHPYDYVVTSGTRVHLYSGSTHTVQREFTKFTDIAYSGAMREDGRLLCAGGKEGLVQVFDVTSRLVLRKYRKHQGPVHVAQFIPGSTLLLTASDDSTIRNFDIPTQAQVLLLEGHTDHVRAAAVVDGHTIVSGGYDHKVKLWDSRTGTCVLTADHDSPIDAVCVLPGSTLIATAGGTTVKIWDILAAFRMSTVFSNHHKNVTCLAVDGENRRLLSGGLDHKVKIYNLQANKLAAQLQYRAPVLSVAMTGDNGAVVVGMTSGAFAVRCRDMAQTETKARVIPGQVFPQQPPAEMSAHKTYKYFMRGSSAKPDPWLSTTTEYKERREKDGEIDQHLKVFEYKIALDKALQAKNPVVIMSLIDELILRDGLERAIAGRAVPELESFLWFLSKYIINPTFTKTLVKVAHLTLDLYVGVVGSNVRIDELMRKLREHVIVELKFQKTATQATGLVELLLNSHRQARMGSSISVRHTPSLSDLKPAEDEGEGEDVHDVPPGEGGDDKPVPENQQQGIEMQPSTTEEMEDEVGLTTEPLHDESFELASQSAIAPSPKADRKPNGISSGGSTEPKGKNLRKRMASEERPAKGKATENATDLANGGGDEAGKQPQGKRSKKRARKSAVV